MTKTPDILCIGSVLWDVIGRTASHMRVGSDVPGRITRLPGGVAMNIAMTLRRFGMTPALLTALLLSWLAAAPAGFASSFGQLDGNPNLRSESAMVIDANGNLIYGKDVDTVRPIASITKLMTGVVVSEAHLPLDETITLYERGEALRKHCQARLDSAQQRIERIVTDQSGAAIATQPFDSDG